MSVRVMSQVWDEYHGPATRKLVLLCLADFSDDRGIAWPSVKTIARKSDVAESTIYVHLAALRKEGVIVAQGFAGSEYQGSRRYQIITPSGIRTPSRIRTPSGSKGNPLRDPESPPPGSGDNPPVNHQEPPGGSAGPVRDPGNAGQTASGAPVSTPVSDMDKKRQKAKLEGAMFKALARLGVAVTATADREAWKGLLMQVRPKDPDEATAIVATCIDLFRESTGKELRWPSEARTWIERAARHHRNKDAA